MYAKSHRKTSFEMRISNHGTEVFSSYDSRKSRNEICVWMTWPQNRVLGGGASVTFLTISTYNTARCTLQRKRKQHTCMFDWQATQSQPCLFSTLSKGESHFRSLVCIMRNSKYASTSIMCTLRNSKCAFRIKIQNTHFAVVWKQSIPLSNW